MNCNFTQQPDGTWICANPGCGWHYKKATAKPPKRNCPKYTEPSRSRPLPARSPPPLPTLPELIERVRRDLAERVGGKLPAMLPEIVRRVVICHSNGCGRFDGTTCADCGRECERWNSWSERLVTGNCTNWQTND